MIVISSLQIRRGLQLLLESASATITPGQKIGLVGKNGSGKSTLLSLLKGELSADSGTIDFPASWTLAWVNQETPALAKPAIEYVIDGDRQFRQLEQQLKQANEQNDGHAIALIHDQLDTIQAWTIQARSAALLHGLGFLPEQIQQPVRTFSGGWRMRLNLAQALLCRSDLLLLDEPTNHLDLDAVIWLEKWLCSYPGTLILISHDRDFLDPIVEKIIHIEQCQLHEYSGNYSSFEQQRATRLAQQQSLFKQQQEKIAHLQSYVNRFKAKASKAKQAQSRVKMLERMELIAPAYIDNPFHFTFPATGNLPNPLLRIDKVSVGYQQHTVLSSIKLNLVPGSRIGLLGHNGAGKSTLIKLLAGELSPQQGEFTLAKGVRLGYFAQHQLEFLHQEESALQHLATAIAQTAISQAATTEQRMRDYLGGFGFQGDKVHQPTAHFSGGEKARLVLALLVWQRPNLLLLDEPTNHLDLDMRQALTEALTDFEGALIVVSHDRHLLRCTTDELYLVHGGKVALFPGDLDDYQQWLSGADRLSPKGEDQVDGTLHGGTFHGSTFHNGTSHNGTSHNSAPLNNAFSRKEQKRREAEQRAKTQPLRKQISKVEQQMAKLQTYLDQLDNTLADNTLYQPENKNTLTQTLQQQAELRSEMAQCGQLWFTMQEQLEEMVQLFESGAI